MLYTSYIAVKHDMLTVLFSGGSAVQPRRCCAAAAVLWR